MFGIVQHLPRSVAAFLLPLMVVAATLASCEDDPILTPDDNGGGAGGSYGTIKIVIEPQAQVAPMVDAPERTAPDVTGENR